MAYYFAAAGNSGYYFSEIIEAPTREAAAAYFARSCADQARRDIEAVGEGQIDDTAYKATAFRPLHLDTDGDLVDPDGMGRRYGATVAMAPDTDCEGIRAWYYESGANG